MIKKTTAFVMIAMIFVASSQPGFAASNPETSINDLTNEIPQIQGEDIDVEIVQDAITYMEHIGFDVNGIRAGDTELIMSAEINDVKQTISVEEASDSCIAMNITEGSKSNDVVFTDDGRLLIDGSEISSEASIVSLNNSDSIGQIKSDRRIVTYRSKPSYGVPADYIKHHTVKRVISFGEKYAYQFTMGAFVLLMGKELIAAGLLTVSVADVSGLALGTFLSGIMAYNPYQSAVSLQDVVSYHSRKGLVISPVLTISKHTIAFYATKYYTYPTGPSRTVYEESWLDAGI